ncbi:nudix hydrolase 3-like [Rutidosis leptorrhynchoides]|uniref:nudix hydrolase 3-like n=1 Tax=Rutidosis leptorrhynchoides TaxID=125765 RepID=UPI003A993741
MKIIAAPIRVIQLVYNAGDVKGPQTVAFNLPNDECIVKDRGTSMVMLKNVSEAKFLHILLPIADACIAKDQQGLVDFDSFFTQTICHECCHGIGPHLITLPSGQKSTVRLELQELHSALEEAKADIVGLWALQFLISKKELLQSMYVSFLAGCFRSVWFGLEEAHGKIGDEGQGREVRKLAVAYHKRRNGKSEFIIAQSTKGILCNADESFIGTLTSNLMGSKYNIWNQGKSLTN